MRYYLTIIIVYLCNTLASGQGIAVSPSRIFFQGQPGQSVSQTIRFSNTSTTEFSFVAAMKDWDRDSLGVKKYYPAGTMLASNAGWLQLSENALQLAPGEEKSINLTINIPQDSTSTGQTNSMLFFTQVKKQQANMPKGFNVNVLLEVGVQVYHSPAGLAKGDLAFLAFEDRGLTGSEAQRSRALEVKIKNTGEINKDAYVRFELTNMETGQEVVVDPIAIAMLPQAEQWVRFSLPADLDSGKYLAVAMLDAGSQYELKVAEKEITY